MEIGALLMAGYFLGVGLGWSETRSLFLGACLCISSTMAVSKILEQDPLLPNQKQLIYGVLVLQDVAAIALIAVMTAVAQGEQASLGEVLSILGKLCAALAGMLAVGMFVVPRLVRHLHAAKSREVLVVGAVGLCFSFALLAKGFGYSTALGAFIGGILVAESGLGHQVENAIASVRDVFVAVFFVSIGMSVNPEVALSTLPTSLLVLGVVVVTQFVSVTLAGTASGNGLGPSATAGLALGQIGEFAFIIGAIGVSARVVGPEFQSILVTVAVLSTFTTSLTLRLRGPILKAVQRAIPRRLARVLVLYESWWQQLREPTAEPKHTVTRLLGGLFLDLMVMAGLILLWQAWHRELGDYLVQVFHLGEELSHTVAVVALGASLLPLLVPLILGARALSRTLAERALPAQGNAQALLTTSLSVLIVATVGVPGTFLLGRAVGIVYVWPAFALALLASGWLAWRKVNSVDSEMRSGGMLVLQVIAGQGFSDESHENRPSLPGVRNMVSVTLSEADFAVGKTLTELELRTSTGASVVALKDLHGNSIIPTGAEVLFEGATLYLAGTPEAQGRAAALLAHGGGTHEAQDEPRADKPVG